MAETGIPYHLQTEQSRTRWVEQIEQHFAVGEYASAQEAVAAALQEFPDDREMQGLAVLAEAGLRRSAEAARLLERARNNLAGGNSEEAVKELRRAERLDERNSAVRTALVAALVERGRALLATDREAAEPLVKEALELERSNPLVRSLASLIENYKHQGSAVHAPELEKPELVATQKSAGPQGSAIAVSAAEAPSGSRPVLEDALPASATVVLAAEVPVPPAEAAPPPEIPEPPKPKPKPKLPILAAVVVVLVVAIGIAAFFLFRQTAPSTVAVSLAANAPGATFTVDGQPAQASLRLKPGSHTVIAAADGYISGTQTFALKADAAQPVRIAVNLQPALPELHFASALKAGRLVIDNRAPVDLTDGAASLSNLAIGDHTLKVFDGKREVFSLSFRVQPKQVPSLMAPLTGREARAVVIASMGNSAKIYASPGMKAGLGDAPMAPVAASGLALSNLTNANLNVADGSAKPHLLPIETSAAPSISVILNGAPERIPLLVKANVPDAVVLIDGVALKTPMTSGSRILPLLPGTFHIQAAHKGYETSAEQTVEIKAGEKPQPLVFTLTPLVQYATLSVSGAPAQTEVWIDSKRAGEIDGAGQFSQKIPAGTHQVSLRKPDFEQVSLSQDFKPNEVVHLNGKAVRPYGTIHLKVTPADAQIAYVREGDTESHSAATNQTVPLPQGIYRITAGADQYISKSATIKVVPGTAVSLAWTLKPVAKPKVADTPASMFEDGSAWMVKGGWWIHDADGYSFLKRRQGSFEIDILQESQKVFLHSNPKRVNFVADYVNEDNRIAYTLDGRNLMRRVFKEGHGQRVVRIPFGLDASRVYRLVTEIDAQSVTIKTVAGKKLDSVKTSGPMGKFGFRDAVVLVVR